MRNKKISREHKGERVSKMGKRGQKVQTSSHGDKPWGWNVQDGDIVNNAVLHI